MSQANIGRRNLISDILSPFSKGGYDVENTHVRRQPIGQLHQRYLRRRALKGTAGDTVYPQRDNRVVRPLTAIHETHLDPKPRSLKEKAASLGLISLLAGASQTLGKRLHGLKQSIGGRSTVYDVRHDPNPTDSQAWKLAVPIIVVIAGLIWLLSSITHGGLIHRNATAKDIPVLINSSTASSNNQSKNSGQKNPTATPSQSTNTPTASAQPFTGYTAGGSSLQPSSSTGTPVGGMGGGPAGSGGTTSTASGTLPLNLSVPPVNTSADGKTILDTSGTTVTVN